MMKVELMAWTPDPVLTCARAARVSHSSRAAEDIHMDNPGAFIKRLLAIGHESVIEHASFTFSVSNISRVCSHQLVRHRLASYTQQSQRYVKQKARFILPVERPEIKALYEEAFRVYQLLLEKGVRKEDARYVLPQGISTNIVVTMNARELRHFFRLRLDPAAQWEIRILALKMFELVYPIAPAFFEDIKPLADRARQSLKDRKHIVVEIGSSGNPQ